MNESQNSAVQTIVRAIINNSYGNILFNSGEQTSLISKKFIKRNKGNLRDLPILPVLNRIIRTTVKTQNVIKS